MGLDFWLNSALLGAGLAADAFSVSVANGLANPFLSRGKSCAVAGTFAFFQFLMPMIGWYCVHTAVQKFGQLQRFVPYIALLLLLYIGGKMIWENLHSQEDNSDAPRVLNVQTLTVQGIATSIDALSVGFTIESYSAGLALAASGVIGAVTFVLCLLAIRLGKVFGARFRRAELIGGLILIGIGLEIFIKGVIA